MRSPEKAPGIWVVRLTVKDVSAQLLALGEVSEGNLSLGRRHLVISGFGEIAGSDKSV